MIERKDQFVEALARRLGEMAKNVGNRPVVFMALLGEALIEEFLQIRRSWSKSDECIDCRSDGRFVGMVEAGDQLRDLAVVVHLEWNGTERVGLRMLWCIPPI